MISTTIRHGDLVVDFDAAGWVQITRQSNAQCIQISTSEWVFLLKCAELRGWPMSPPGVEMLPLDRSYGTQPPGIP